MNHRDDVPDRNAALILPLFGVDNCETIPAFIMAVGMNIYINLKTDYFKPFMWINHGENLTKVGDDVKLSLMSRCLSPQAAL